MFLRMQYVLVKVVHVYFLIRDFIYGYVFVLLSFWVCRLGNFKSPSQKRLCLVEVMLCCILGGDR